MAKKLLWIMVLTGIFGAVFGQATNTGLAEENKKPKVLLLPLINQTDTNTFKEPGIAYETIFRSFYNFIGVIPMIDVPPQEELTKIQVDLSNIAATANAQKADFIVCGTYRLEGSIYAPRAKVNLLIWSKKDNKLIFQKEYDTPTDIELFDTLDDMVENIVKSILKMSLNVGIVNFENFDIGTEKYSIYVNSKLIAMATNEKFYLNLKLLAGNKYNIQIQRDWDKVFVAATVLDVKKGDYTNVSYKARGDVSIKAVRNKERKKVYSILLDGNLINVGDSLSGLKAGITHKVVMLDQTSKEVYSEEFYLKDGEKKAIEPKIKWAGVVHPRVYTMGNSMLGAGCDFYLTRYFWISPFAGVSIQDFSFSVLYLTIGFDFGMYFLNDMTYDVRMGAGIVAKQSNVFGADLPNELRRLVYKAGLFYQFEWKILYVKLDVLFNLNDPNSRVFDLGTDATGNNNILYQDALTLSVGVKF